jgi:hypothetical protein
MSATHCHSSRFIVPPDRPTTAQESARDDSDPPEVRLARSMRPVLEQWDRMGPGRREQTVRVYGAALAAICGIPVARLKAETRVNPQRLAAIVAALR